jgi:GNAT superfamily N-acetyltransferase
MSVFFISDREAQQARADAAQPSTRNPGFFDDPQGDGGVFEGTGQSFVSGLDTGAAGLTGWLANANRRIGYFAADEDGVGWRTDGEDWFTGYLEERRDEHRQNMQRTRIDPRTRSEAANMVGDLTRVLTMYTAAGAAGGPLALLTGTAGGGMGLGYDEYDRLREMGADEETALGGARIAGTYGALGGAAPVAVPGRILTRALTGAGMNVGLGAGQRGQTSAYLEDQGYPDLALQYNWLDPQAAVVDGLFGGIFGAAFGSRAPETVRPHAGDDDAEGGQAPLLPPDADGFFEEARQYGTDEQFAEAYAYALIARDMGHPEADGLLAILEEDASAADIDAGTAIANQIAQSQLGAGIGPEARDAARVQGDTIQRATAFGIPVDAASRRWQSEATSRAEMQAARDEEIDVGPVPEGVDFVPLDDIEMMASEIEYAARAVEDAPQSLNEWVRRQGEVRDARGRVVTRGGIRDDRGEVAGGAGDGLRGFASLLSPNGRTLDDLALSAWESGFFPGLVDRPTINEFLDALDRDARNPGSVNADESASFEVRNSRDILRYYESRNIDIALRGPALRQALRPLAVDGVWDAALRAFEEEAREQGLEDVAGDVRRMREERGGDVGPFDDDAFFSFGARRAPARGAESWRGEAGFSDPRLTEGERKAVEMARNNYSNAEIADELDTSAATVSALLSKARAKIGQSAAGRGTPSGRPVEVSTERLVRMREELRRAGVPANKTRGSDRTILKVMAERTGLSREAVKQRLWQYDRQVETGVREPLKSMGAVARKGRSTVDELQAVAVDEFGDAWENLVRAGLAEIVQSKTDVASERGLPRGVQAVHMRGADKSYFIANNISPENLRGLILHELGVHHGMEEMLGERGKRALLRQVSAMVRAGQPDVARAMRFAKADNPGRPEVHAEEALAYLVEMQADLPLVQSMLSRVRQWLIKTFGTTFGMRLTVDDLRALTIASLRRLSERARREAADMTPIEPVPLYSQGPDAGAGRGGQRPQTEAPEFRRWFGQSKVVDADGNPLVVYHGTAADFESFDNSKTGRNDSGLWGRGHYFAASADSANSYALRQGDGARVIPAYVSIENPLVLKTGDDLVTRLPDGTNSRELVGPNLDGSKIKALAVAGGHDGVIQIRPNGLIGDVVAYSPEQIRSAFARFGESPARAPNAPDVGNAGRRFEESAQGSGDYRNLSMYGEGEDAIGYMEYKPRNDGSWMVRYTSVDPLVRGQGNGVALYEELIRRARASGATRIVSDAHVSDDAQNVYAALRRRGYDVRDVDIPGYPAAEHGQAHEILLSNAPARGDGGDDPLFSMGARGQNALDPVESPRFQARLSDVEQRLIADGVLRERALGGEGAARGGGADQPGLNRARSGEGISGRSGRGRGDNQGNAEPARIPRDIAQNILSVSGLRLAKDSSGAFGKYQASIDLPHDLVPEYALAFAEKDSDYPTRLRFDLTEGATPRLLIRWSGLNPSLRNTGAGKWLYRQLIDWGLERGYEVYSDFSVSPSAQRVYTALGRMGYVIGRNPRATPKSDGTLSTNDLKPVFRVRGGDTAEILMSAPAPRGGYEIDGPTLKDRMAPMREEAARQAEYDALPAAEQILRDQPEMLFSFGVARMRADELVAMVEAENNAAREMTKGVDAAAHCAIRHGVGQAVSRSAGATFLTLNNQGAAGIMLGQVTGLALAVPVGVTAAPLIANDARRISPQQRRVAEMDYAINQTQEAAQIAMDRAREQAGALGLDEPTDYASGKPVALEDVADPNGMDPAPQAGGTPWQDYTPLGGRPLLSGNAPDAPADYTPPRGGKTTPEGSPVSAPPAPGPSDNPSPPANGSDLIDLLIRPFEGDE